jgi:hypothetical protein
MTVSLKIHVNGNYRATVRHMAGGYEQPQTVVGPQEEKTIYFWYDVVNELVVIEEYLGETAKPASERHEGVTQAVAVRRQHLHYLRHTAGGYEQPQTVASE